MQKRGEREKTIEKIKLEVIQLFGISKKVEKIEPPMKQKKKGKC